MSCNKWYNIGDERYSVGLNSVDWVRLATGVATACECVTMGKYKNTNSIYLYAKL